MMRTPAIAMNLCVLSLACLIGLPGCATALTTGAEHAENQACATAEFASVRLQNRVRPSIVRIESDIGTATGFVLNHRGDGILIATNHHVVQGGSKFDIILDSGARVANVEVVKVDVEHDLALLNAPGLGRMVPGLVLSSQSVVLAEHVAALGYPYVSGERAPSLTFEDGSVTNVNTELDKHTYIRTNANINPGNSGGPVVDACAQVVGIVDAVHEGTQRTGLVIPVAQLRSLLAVHDAPRTSPEAEIASRIGVLETAVRYRRGPDVAAMFSRQLLSEKTMKVFVNNLKTALEAATARLNKVLVTMSKQGKPVRVHGRIITDYNALPPDARSELIATALNEQEKQTVMLAYMISEKKIDANTAMIAWLGQFAHEMFGNDPSFKLDRVTLQSKNSARSQVMVGAASSSRFWIFDWVYEWGDWRLDAFSCVRGCS